MNTKLTLNIDKYIIENAKDYAKRNKISLSKLIESYLNSLTHNKKKKRHISPLVESLTGVIPKNSDINDKDEYFDYLSQKYQ